MIATFEPNGEATPETRAAILGEYLRLASLQTAPVDYGVVFRGILESLQAREELISMEISMVHFMLCSAGLIQSNTVGRIGNDTTVSSTPDVRRFVWSDDWIFSPDEVDL